MIGAPLLADAILVLDVHEGPDSRGRYEATCPECEQPGLRLELDGAEKIIPTCPRRCLQVRINQAIKKRIQAKGNGSSRRHDAPKAKTSPKKTAATENPIEAEKRDLLQDPETGNLDYLRFQARCVKAFDPAVGIFLRQATYWHGRSTKLRDGWMYKKREEWCEETGLTHRQVERARRVLLEKGILEESRPSRRAPMHFRIDLEALKDALEAEE